MNVKTRAAQILKRAVAAVWLLGDFVIVNTASASRFLNTQPLQPPQAKGRATFLHCALGEYPPGLAVSQQSVLSSYHTVIAYSQVNVVHTSIYHNHEARFTASQRNARAPPLALWQDKIEAPAYSARVIILGNRQHGARTACTRIPLLPL